MSQKEKNFLSAENKSNHPVETELSENWRLSLRQLEIFRAVAETGGLRAAARNLGLTQPAITHAMKALEKTIDAPLFQRKSEGTALTDIGQTLLHHAHLVFNEIKRAQIEISQMKSSGGNRISVAFSSSAIYLLAPALREFRHSNPNVTIELQEIEDFANNEQWASGYFDFGITSEIENSLGQDYQQELLKELPLMIMAKIGHPLASIGTLDALQASMWVYPDYGKPLMARLFSEAGLEPPADYVLCRSVQLTLRLLHQTDAICILSGDADDSLQRLFSIAPITVTSSPLGTLRLMLASENKKTLSPASRQFAHCIRYVAGTAPHILE